VKKIIVIIFFVSSVYSDAIDFTFSITHETWRIKFHAQPTACHSLFFEIDTVCNIEIPKQYDSLVLSGLNSSAFLAPGSNCCGEHPNAYLELINWTTDKSLKLYFWQCDFNAVFFRLNTSIYQINLKRETVDFLKSMYAKYAIPVISKSGLDSMRVRQKSGLESFKSSIDNLNNFDKNVIDATERPENHLGSHKNKAISLKIDSLRAQLKRINVIMKWDTTDYRFKLTPLMIQNPDTISKYYDAIDDKIEQ
jgi:hypothetical protein